MLNKYLTYNADNSITFIGSDLTIKITKRFENYGMLSIGDNVQALAIFELCVDGGPSRGFFLPAKITMIPSEITEITENGQSFYKLIFKKGDTFIKSRRVVKNGQIAYIVFAEFVEKGYCPNFISYEHRAFLFDIVQQVTGTRIPAEHAMFEIIFAHLSRDRKNVYMTYRLTDMKDTPLQLALKDVAHATTSVTAKLVGGYLSDALTVATVNHADNISPIEELLRV